MGYRDPDFSQRCHNVKRMVATNRRHYKGLFYTGSSDNCVIQLCPVDCQQIIKKLVKNKHTTETARQPEQLYYYSNSGTVVRTVGMTLGVVHAHTRANGIYFALLAMNTSQSNGIAGFTLATVD